MTLALWQLLIGSVWGITNALMKQGAVVAEEKRRKRPLQPDTGSLLHRLPWLRNWLLLLAVWEYSVPFAVNLVVSSLFFFKLQDISLSTAVPVINAITFAVTAITGAGLGEPVDAFYTGIGIALATAGVFLCISSASS